jgi:acetamidase/formamidase
MHCEASAPWQSCLTFLFQAAALVCLLVPSAHAQRMAADHYLPSKPENVVWGWIPLDAPPVLTIRSGQTVRIDTISHQGATQAEDPVTFLAPLGVKPEEILQDARDFWASRASRSRQQGRTGAHILTGPVAITGAEPGDTLEVQILELSTRVPWGINTAGATSGVFGADYPGTKPGDPGSGVPAGPNPPNLIRTAVVNGREVALFSEQIRIPLAPFMGIMAVAPRDPQVGQPGVTVAKVQSSRPPGPYGGNMDLKALAAGARLFLPIFQPGALFLTGDPHGVQGDGEVSGNALEQSLTGVFRFVLHKGKTITAPRAETATHYIMMGIDSDLDRAMRMATCGEFSGAREGNDAGRAFSLQPGVDFRVSEGWTITERFGLHSQEHLHRQLSMNRLNGDADCSTVIAERRS